MPSPRHDSPEGLPALMPKLPAQRPSRVVVEPVSPVVDGGRFAAKVSLGEPVTVMADVFGEGHDAISVGLRWRTVSAKGGRSPWTEQPMHGGVNDRYTASFFPDRLGRYEFEVFGWSARAETWRSGTAKKIEADLDVSVELLGGRAIVADVLGRARAARGTDDDVAALDRLLGAITAGDTGPIGDPTLKTVFWRYEGREPIAASGSYPVDVDPVRGRFSAWYEFFPRSTVDGAAAPRHAARRDRPARPRRVDGVRRAVPAADPPDRRGESQGPQQHHRGGTRRRRQPVGHRRPHRGAPRSRHARRRAGPHRRVQRARARAGTRHRVPVHARPPVGHRAPGRGSRSAPTARSSTPRTRPRSTRTSTRSTSRPTSGRRCGKALADVFRFWIDQGVTIFRVDNPHTKAFPFWEWCIGTLRAEHPETIFLAEAFTRPRVMERSGEARVQPVVHLLRVAAVGVGAARVLHRPVHAHRRLLPPERVAEHARHPDRAVAARRAGDLRQPGDPRRDAERQLGHLRPGVRAAREPPDPRRVGGVPRLGEVPAAPVAARRSRFARAADHAPQRDPAFAAGAPAPAHAAVPRRRRATGC